jgi:adenine-specific DNA-methyltransferase
MGGSGAIELRWHNKHLALRPDGEAGYRWAASHEPAESELIHELGSVVDDGAGEALDGLLIVGDALPALLALTREQSRLDGERIRLVYIDPPFNRGQGFPQYDDSLAHSVWLSMLRDRLMAVKPLLAPSASVWVHLDDAEQHRGRCVLDEVFGENAFVATIVWQTRTTRESRSAFSSNHDYIHVYAPAGPQQWKQSRNLLPKGLRALRNRDDDPRGPWADAPFTAPGYRANQHYDILNPAGHVLRPPTGRSWYATRPVYDQLVEDGRIWFPRGGAGLPRIKMFPEHLRGLVPFSLWGPEEVGTNDDAKRHLIAMFPAREPFATPKPEALMERIIHIASDPGELVLDFFAGSGTTAAVAHKMRRRWIAVERSPSTATTFTIPRLTSVVRGLDLGGVTGLTGWQGGGGFAIAGVGDKDSIAIDVSPPSPSMSATVSGTRRHARPQEDSPAAATLFDVDRPAGHVA